MATESIGSWPVWVWGEARVDGEEIVLTPDKVEVYDAPNSEHHAALLYDLAALRDFKLQDPAAFVRRHGLIWHGPDQVQQRECRESLQWWRTWGTYLATTIGLYATLQEGLDTNTAEPVREYMRAHRDVEWGYGIIPDIKDDLLEYASILLAERITNGLQGCEQTLVAACGVTKGGKPIGPAGDFYYRTKPTDLIGAAHLQLASLVVNKAEARQCKGCGRWFVPKHGSQWYHTPECGRNKRRRDSYRNTKNARARGSNAAAIEGRTDLDAKGKLTSRRPIFLLSKPHTTMYWDASGRGFSDSKSGEGNLVWDRAPPPAQHKSLANPKGSLVCTQRPILTTTVGLGASEAGLFDPRLLP